MARSNAYNYAQTILGMCGHICQMWPLIRTQIGNEDSDEVICEECTRKRYGISPEEDLHVWVRVDRTEEKKQAAKKATVRKAAPKKPKVKQVICSVCREKGHDFMRCPKVTAEVLL